MIQTLNNEASKSHKIFSQVQDIQESVRIAFLNCLVDFAGNFSKNQSFYVDFFYSSVLYIYLLT